MSQKKTLAKNTILLFVSRFSAQFVSLVLLPVYTARFSPNDYGFATLALTYISLLVPLLALCLDLGIFRFMIDARGNKKQIAEYISSTFTIVLPLMALVLFGGSIVGLVFNIPLFMFILINIITTILYYVLSQMVRGLGHTKSFVMASIVGTTISFAVTLLGIFLFGLGFEIILIAPIMSNVVGILILACQTRIYRYIRPSVATQKTRRRLISYSAPLIPDSISFWIMNTSDRTILSIVLGVASNGIYTISNKVAAVMDGIIGVFFMSWSEAAALAQKKPNRDRFYSETLQQYLKIFWSMCLLLIAVIPFVFPFLVQGDEFSSAYLYIPILIIAVGARAVQSFLSAIYQAQKLTRQIAVTTIVGAVINIVTNIALIFWVGVWAAAISTLAAYAILSVYRYFDIRKYGVVLRLSPRLLVLFMALAVIICTFYYINIFWLNVVGVLVAIGVGGWLNWEVLRAGWGMVLGKFKRG